MFFDKVSRWIDESAMLNTTGMGGASPAVMKQLKGFTAVDTPIAGTMQTGTPTSQLVEQATWTLIERNQVFDKIDSIADTPIADKVKNTIITDAFFDLTGSHAMSFKYVDDEHTEKAVKFSKDIDEFLRRTNVIDILKDCIVNEGMDYSEIFLSTPVKPGIGITEVSDNLDVRELLAIYKNTNLVGALKFDVQGKRAQGKGFLKAKDISHFLLNYKKKPIKISKRFADKYNISEKVRVAKPLLAGVYDLIQQYNALEQLQSALELIKATQGIYLGIGISPEQDQERVAKQLQEFTNKFNRNRQNVIENIENINLSTLMSSMNKIEFVPFSVEEGTNSVKQIEVEYAENNLSEILNNIRKTIALGVGIPEDKLSISTSGVRGTKEDSITTNPSYSKLLSSIQQLLAKGIREMLYKHLKYKYMNEEGICTAYIDKSKIEIMFSSTTNLNDRLEDENMLLKAETVGRMLSVVESLASSGTIPVKVAGEHIVEYWKAQLNKDVHLRNAIELMSEEEQRQLQLMMSGGYVGAEEDVPSDSEAEPDESEDEQVEKDDELVEKDDEPEDEQVEKDDEEQKGEDDIKKALDKEPTAKQEEEEAEKAEEVVAKSKSGKKTRRKRATKKESGDIRDIFY